MDCKIIENRGLVVKEKFNQTNVDGNNFFLDKMRKGKYKLSRSGQTNQTNQTNVSVGIIFTFETRPLIVYRLLLEPKSH